MATLQETADFVGYLSGEEPADVFAWLTGPRFGRIDEENEYGYAD